jgi:hypothetical protein
VEEENKKVEKNNKEANDNKQLNSIKKCMKGIEKKDDNSYILNTDSKTDIEIEKYYSTLEILITNMYDKFYRDLTTRKNQSSYSHKGEDKKEIILLFERVIKSLRYLVIGNNQVYKDIADPLELLAQLCDMNNIDGLLNDLISKYVNYYDKSIEMCTIKNNSFRIEL